MDIETVQAFIRGKENMPILHVRDSDDPKYKTIEKLVMDINPKTEDYMSAVAGQMNKLMSSLRHMEASDYNRIVTTFRKYEVKGSSGGVSGRGSYGYDRSRIDGHMIKRKRSN